MKTEVTDEDGNVLFVTETPKRAPLEGAVRNPRAVVSARIAQLFEDARAFCATTYQQKMKREIRRLRRRAKRHGRPGQLFWFSRQMRRYEGVRL